MAASDTILYKKMKLEHLTSALNECVAKALGQALTDLQLDISTGFCLLKLINSDAQCCQTFPRCSFKTERSTDRETFGTKKVFQFSSVFKYGSDLLQNFLDSSFHSLQISRTETVALERLMSFLLKKEDIEEKLMQYTKSKAPSGTELTISLAHHLLTELAINQTYKVDERYRYKNEFSAHVTCCCCQEEDKHGHYADCSIGHPEVWHGNVDVIIGNVAVGISKSVDDEEGGNMSAFEIKNKKDLYADRYQMIAESIVFALLQKKQNPHLKHFLIPTIAVSCTDVIVFLYDGQHDILLESPVFPLFTSSGLYLPTILVLWLTINYQTFSSGITRGMVERKFTADFFCHENENVKSIYRDKLFFGNVMARKSNEGYFKPDRYGFVYDEENESLQKD